MMITDKDPLVHHGNLRKQLWINAWTATANATNCVSSATATDYADAALAAFDKRFPEIRTNYSALTEEISEK
jgi:hypothetical protein